jgi:hypothetical protein
MLSSRLVVHADIFSETHRISCRVVCGMSGLVGQLNDVNTSLVEIEEVYYSRLQQPAQIVAHFESAHVAKDRAALIVLARREDLGPHGLSTGGFSRRIPAPAVITTPEYEVRGRVDVLNKWDPTELLVGGTGRFLQVHEASAVATLYPDTTFSGAVILVNRNRIEMMALASRSKT